MKYRAFFHNLIGTFSQDLGIDLGTANTLVYLKGKGIVINEPSVVAVNTRTDQVLAVGDEAKLMLGKTPGHIVASRPLVDGIISDFEITEQMLTYFIGKVTRSGFGYSAHPRVVIGVPLDITEVERKAVEDAVLGAGAREVYLVEEPMAAAIGARLPVGDPSGNLIVDIGGGTTEIAVIALGGVVASRSLKIAGDELNQEIIEYARSHFNLLLGEKSAEAVKIEIGSAVELPETMTATIRGRDLMSGLPRAVEVTDADIREALRRPLDLIIDNIKTVIELTPPELVSDIYEKGITLSGGGSLLRGLDTRISNEAGVPVTVTDDPLTAVARGTGVVLEDIDHLRDILIPSANIVS